MVYKKAINIDPNLAKILVNLATSLIFQDRLVALRIDTRNAEVYVSLGIANCNLGRYS